MSVRSVGLAGILSAVSTGTVIAVTDIMIEVSFAALIFSGPLAPFLPAGIGYFLFGAIIIGFVISIGSSFSHAIAFPQDTPAVLLAVVAAAITTQLQNTADTSVLFYTVVAMMALASILTGVLFFLLGTFELGNLTRYVPYPVIGGFLAGTGWLLVDGASSVMIGSGIALATLPELFQVETLARWLPGLVLAVLILKVLRRYSHPLILPGLLLTALLLFHMILFFMGTPAEGAREAGWLLGPFPEGGLWQPLSLAALRQVEWSAILLQSGTLGTLLLIALLSFLLNASGLELAIRQDVDLNRELKVAGLANALGGLGGGPVGYHALSLSALSHRMTPVGRATGVVVALVYALVLLVGASFLSFFPTFILGGVLLFLGLDFLVTWLVDTWSRLSRSEYMIVVLIALVMAVVGVLEGVALGVFLAMVLFIVDYGRASPIRHVLTGETYRSTVDRPEVQRHVLQQYGDRIYILQLQRFIFFGTANRLLDTVRQRVARIDAPLPCFIILDFHRVSGLDASAVSSFDKMRQLAARRDIELIFSGLRAAMRSRLVTLAESEEGEAGLRIFQDLDHALERCEEQILSGNVAAIGAVELDLQRPPHAIRHLLEYMSPQRVEAGEYLIQQGDYLEGFYFLHQGGLTVQLGSADGQVVRLRKMRPGVFIGELSLYTGAPASASVMADEPSTVYFLSGSELARLEEDAPAVATVIHRQIAKLVSERLLDATRTISNLRM